ncbi:hypothetical protein BKA82DRAFT_993088 [Pisolithus tinctorius]|nr:hypothetical protein BKA82DRAFT_993088 [Pisolithus tinctorius]
MQAPTGQDIFQSTRLDASHYQAQHGATRLVWPLYPPSQPLASGVDSSAPLFISDAFMGTPPLSRSSSRTSTTASSSSLPTPTLRNLIMSNIFHENVDQYDDALDATAPLVPTLAPPLLCAANIATGTQPSLPLPLSQHQPVHIDHAPGSSHLVAPGGFNNYAGNMPGGGPEDAPQAAPSGLPTSYPFTFKAYPQMENLLNTLAAMEQGSLGNQSTLQFSENFGLQAGPVYQQHVEGRLLNGVNIQSPENLAPAYQEDASDSGSHLNGAHLQFPAAQPGSVHQQHRYNSRSYLDEANFQSPDLAGQTASVYQPHASNSGSHLNGAGFQSPENVGVQLGSVYQQHGSNSGSLLNGANLHSPENVGVQLGSVYQQHASHSENHLSGANFQSPERFEAQDAHVYQQHASDFGSPIHSQGHLQLSHNLHVQPGPVYELASSSGSHHLQGMNSPLSGNVGMQSGSVYQQQASNSGGHYIQGVNSQSSGNVGVQSQTVYQQHASNPAIYLHNQANSQSLQNLNVQPGSVYQQHATYLHNQASLHFSQNLNVQPGRVYQQHASNPGNNVATAPIHHVRNPGPSAPGVNLGTNPTHQSVFVVSTSRNSNVPRVNGGSVQTTANNANPGTSPATSATLYVQQIQPSGGLSTVSTRPAGASGKRSRADFEGKTNESSEPPAKQAKKSPVAKQSKANAGSIKPKRVVKVKEIKRGIPCDLCKRPVTQGREWHHDQTLHHRKAEKPKSKVRGDWLCQICDQRFARNDSCFRHQERLHGGRFPEMMIFAPLPTPIENNPPQSQ